MSYSVSVVEGTLPIRKTLKAKGFKYSPKKKSWTIFTTTKSGADRVVKGLTTLITKNGKGGKLVLGRINKTKNQYFTKLDSLTILARGEKA